MGNAPFTKKKIKVEELSEIERLLYEWGLGIGDWGLGPIPNPQSPIPNPQSPSSFEKTKIFKC